MNGGQTNPEVKRPRRALVVFTDAPTKAWLRPLKKNFRHCFCAVEDPDARVWVMVDALANGIEVRAVPLADLPDPAAFWRGMGLSVVEAGVAEREGASPPPAFFPAPFTCVEAVKRVLGLRAAWVLTPWQLYRQLAKNKKIILDFPGKMGLNSSQ